MMADTILAPGVFATALTCSLVATPFAGRLARRFEVLDRPAARKDHLHPVPLLGGVAVYAAVLVAVLLWADRTTVVGVGGALVGATWLSFLGLWDDRRHLSVLVKLVGQLAGALLLFATGIQVRLPVDGSINLALTVLWVLGITNAFNLLDNMDGLAGGIGAVAAFFFLVMAILSGQGLLVILAAALLGSCLGFLRYNFNPARIFLGDSGSLFLGFVLSVLAIELRFPDNTPRVTWMVPILVLGLPVLDTTLVVFSRARRGRNPLTTPGRDHLSHRLVMLGMSRRSGVLVLYAVAALLGLAALWVSRSQPIAAYGVTGAIGIAGGVVLCWLEWRTAPRLASR